MSQHALKVEKFYSHGAERRAQEADGFLSFGYWEEATRDYPEAAENLLRFFLDRGKLRDVRDMLNVACGNGAETIRIYQALKPRKIQGLDITTAHIETCRKKAAELGLSDKLVFERGDASAMRFPDASFSHVVGIEGPAHFDTREAFFAESFRVLEPGGVLMLTDSISKARTRGRRPDVISRLCLRLWRMPPENWVDVADYRQQLERQGFEVEFLEPIGHKVFPGFASHGTRPPNARKTIETRGVAVGTGLVLISWLLGFAYARGLTDYIIVKAVKPG